MPEYLKSRIVYEFCNNVIQHLIMNIFAKLTKNLAPVFKNVVAQIKKLPVSNHFLECEHFDMIDLHSLLPNNNSEERGIC